MSTGKAVTSIQTSGNGMLERLVCPECNRALQHVSERLHCAGCKAEWPIINGIPHFLGDFPYWGEMPLERMREVNRLARAGSWKSGLLDSLDPAVKRAADMILNLERANWQWLVDLPRESTVLDLGAGTGTTSHALAMHYQEVVALEPVIERVEFMQYRFAQEGLSNIQIVRSSLWTLPFAAGTFDLVAMNGVLEWVAMGKTGDPGELQVEALTKMWRLLKPGGVLYVGIENRLCPEYFFGWSDPHCGLPFVTVLPRPIADWYARKKGHHGYRNYLYSSRGYRNLLTKAGFSSVDLYVAMPSYNHPRYLIPMKDNVYSYYSHNFNSLRQTRFRNVCRNLLLWSGVLKHMEDSFVILARK